MKSKKPAKRKKKLNKLTATEAASLAESSKFKGATYDGIVMDEFANRYSWDKMYDEHRAKRDAAMVYLDNLINDCEVPSPTITVAKKCINFKVFGWSVFIWK